MADHPEYPFTQEIADEICQRLIEGESLRSICRADHMPSAALVCRWCHDYEAFGEQYTRARENQADTLADEMLDIADDAQNDWMEKNAPDNPGWSINGEHVSRSRLRIETRKWLAMKMKPKKWGDKIEHDLKSSDGSMSPKATEGALIEQALRLGIDPKALGLGGSEPEGKRSKA